MVDALNGVALSLSLSSDDIHRLPLIVLMIFGAVVLLPATLFRKWHFYRQRLKRNVITAEFEPPAELTPIEISYLFSGKINQRDICATVILLIQQGLLHVKLDDQMQKRIHAGPKSADVSKLESIIIKNADVPHGVQFTELKYADPKNDTSNKKTKNKTLLKYANTEVQKTLHKKGYISGKSRIKFLRSSIGVAIQIVLFVGFIPFSGMWFYGVLQSGATDLNVLFSLYWQLTLLVGLLFIPLLLISILIQHLRSKIIGREWIITDKLKHLWPQIISYRQYVQLAENDKLQFQSAKMLKDTKRDILTYAVALGFMKTWRKLIT